MLRAYQQNAVNAIYNDLKIDGASLVVMPTGSGKSHVIAEAATMAKPVLVLQPSQELLKQNYDKLSLLINKDDIGIYSASFKSKDIRKFTFATIQSVYKCPEKFKDFELILIDEAHTMGPRNLSSMFTSFIAGIGKPIKVIGFTATPYRLEIGYFRHPNGDLEAVTMLKLLNRMRHKTHKEVFWKRIIYKIDHAELVEQGFLSPLEYIHSPLLPYEEIPVNISHSDYNLEAYSEAIIGEQANILSTISEAQKIYNSIIVYCSTTEQAVSLSSIIKGSRVILGATAKNERKEIVEEFKSGQITTIFNVGVLTTGFDKPDLDCIILLRPTRSLPLYNQILGRLTRIAPNKTKGTIIDLTGVCKQLGKIESFKLYQNQYGKWDLSTEKHDKWHDRILFSRMV